VDVGFGMPGKLLAAGPTHVVERHQSLVVFLLTLIDSANHLENTESSIFYPHFESREKIRFVPEDR
jgi:hypothetical protein